MKSLLFLNKKTLLFWIGLFLFLIGVTLIILFVSSSDLKRGIASFSSQPELEYAEDYLLEEKQEGPPELNSYPSWTDHSKREKKTPDTFEQRLEKERIKEYHNRLLTELEETTGKRPRKTNRKRHIDRQGDLFLEAAKKVQREKRKQMMIEEAKKEGYDIIVDDYLNIISSEKI